MSWISRDSLTFCARQRPPGVATEIVDVRPFRFFSASGGLRFTDATSNATGWGDGVCEPCTATALTPPKMAASISRSIESLRVRARRTVSLGDSRVSENAETRTQHRTRTRTGKRAPGRVNGRLCAEALIIDM